MVVQNDYQPSYADGTSTEYWYGFSAAKGDFVLIGCTGLAGDFPPATRPQEPAGTATCSEA